MRRAQKQLLQLLEKLMTFQRVFFQVLQERDTFPDFPFLIPSEPREVSWYTDDQEIYESKVFHPF